MKNIAPLVDNIPAELKSLPQWVNWTFMVRDGKQTKVPIEPSTRRFAKANDPSTWDSFEAACDTLGRHPNLAGIGFVFTEHDPYAGIDLDRCLDTEGRLLWGADIIESLATYTEVSPSGTGVKAFLRASKRDIEHCRKDGFGPAGDGEIEIYDRNRFFVVTGRTLPHTPAEIADGQTALDDLCARLWPPQGATAPPAAQSPDAKAECLRAMLAMSVPDHNDGSHRLFAACCRCVEYGLSDADAVACIRGYEAACPFPTRYTDDLIVRRLRDAERRCERGAKAPDKPQKGLVFKSVAQLVDEHPELRPAVIHGLLREGETMNVIASPKAGKSWLVTDLALSVATGRYWLETYPCVQGNVLVIDNELHSETTANRIPKVMQARGVDMQEVCDRIFVANVRGRLQDIHSLGAQFDGLQPGQFKLIVLDAFYRFMPRDTDENDNGAMSQVYNLIDSYASRLGCCFVLVHHSSKGNQSGKAITDVGAGAGSQSRATDTHLVLRPHEQPDAIVLDAAVRSWPPVEPRCLRFTFPVWTPADDLDPAALKPERPRKRKADEGASKDQWDAESFAAEFVTGEPQSMAEIIDAAVDTGMSQREANRLLKRAERSGLVHRWREGANRPVAFATRPQPKAEKACSV